MDSAALSERLSDLLARVERDRKAALRRDRRAVRELRVDLKRLHAFTRLVERLNPKYDSSREFALFRPLFKSGAGWRGVQVLQDAALTGLGRHGLGLSPWINELMIRGAAERRSFERRAGRERICRQGRFRRCISTAWSVLPPGALGLRAEEVLHLDLRRLAGLMPGASSDSGLQRLRIETQAVRYTLEIIDEAEGRSGIRAPLDAKLKAVHQALGQWRDASFSRAEFVAFAAQASSGVPGEVRRGFARELAESAASSLAEFKEAWTALFPGAASSE